MDHHVELLQTDSEDVLDLDNALDIVRRVTVTGYSSVIFPRSQHLNNLEYLCLIGPYIQVSSRI